MSFQKFSAGDTPIRPSQREGATAFRTQHPVRPLAGRGAQAPRCWDPNLGPLNFLAVVTTLYTCSREERGRDWYEMEIGICHFIDDSNTRACLFFGIQF